MELQGAYPEFRQREVGLLAISMDGQRDALNMAVLTGAEFPILSDKDGLVAKEYGVYNLLGDGVATPSVFVLNQDGVILWSYIGNSVSDRPSAEDILLRSELSHSLK